MKLNKRQDKHYFIARIYSIFAEAGTISTLGADREKVARRIYEEIIKPIFKKGEGEK